MLRFNSRTLFAVMVLFPLACLTSAQGGLQVDVDDTGVENPSRSCFSCRIYHLVCNKELHDDVQTKITCLRLAKQCHNCVAKNIRESLLENDRVTKEETKLLEELEKDLARVSSEETFSSKQRVEKRCLPCDAAKELCLVNQAVKTLRSKLKCLTLVHNCNGCLWSGKYMMTVYWLLNINIFIFSIFWLFLRKSYLIFTCI